MSNRSTQQSPGTSAVSQINRLKPIPGIDDVAEDITQRPNNNVAAGSTRQPNSVMKEVDPKSTRQKPISPGAAKENKSQMGSVMENSVIGNSVMGNSTMGSVIKPLDLEQQKKQQQREERVEPPSDNSTVFIKTKAVSRPAIVKEPNNWVKKQTVDMTRSLPLGIQPGDIDAKKLMHSHTGVPSRVNSNTAVSAAPASSPTPIQPFPESTPAPTPTNNNSNNNAKNKSNESGDPSAEHLQLRRKSSTLTSREKKSVHQVRTKRSKTPPPPPTTTAASKSTPNSPNYITYTSGATSGATSSISMSQSQSHGKESTSFFSKFAKNLLPSSSSTQPPNQQQQNPSALQKSKSATSLYERKKSKPKENGKK